jgi:superfamily II DNA or RNA helicase
MAIEVTPPAADEHPDAYFRAQLGRLSLRWPEQHDPALRTAQIGAMLAVAGHFATSDEPAQSVLPTGVGKSAVISALPFLIPAKRVLVVVPTRLLRDQLASEFSNLETLRRLQVVDDDFVAPRVRRVDHRLGSVDDWLALQDFDVAVGTPGVLSATHQDVATPPEGLFDLLIFDEAHHLPAATWTGVLNEHQARAALLTATPFRRDRKLLPGRLIYHYTLRQAIADAVYMPVDFIPVQSQEPDFDRDIAQAAIARQRSSPHAEEGSLLLVRTDRVAHAKELVELYEDLGARIGLITGEHSLTHVRQVVKRLNDRDLDGVVSVSALVEGFDLPALKIAAYHRPHRTLPPTLQFVGRIARVTGGDAPAELVAVPAQIGPETAELYREDVAWAELLPRLVDAAVDQELATRTYLSELDSEGPEGVSPSALHPRRMVQVFRTAGMEVHLDSPIARLSRAPVVFRAIDEARTLMAAITERRISPEWIASDALDSFEYQLYLAVYDSARDLLFVAAPSDAAARELRDAVGADGALLISPQLINRWLWRQDLVAYSSVGMRSARAPGARQASYRMLAGSTVEGALLPSESRSYAVGHLIGRRRDGDQVVGIGVSIRRSKIWETAAADSLLEFRDWCKGLAEAVAGDGDAHATAPRLQLALPGALERFPEHPIAVVLAHTLLQGGTALHVPGRGWVDISLFETPAERASDQLVEIAWGFEDSELARIRLRSDGEVVVPEPEPIARSGGTQVGLGELLVENPPYIYFADGSSSQGSTLLVPPAQLPMLPAELYNEWDFTTTDIRAEARAPAHGHAHNVQSRTLAWARENLVDPVLIVDDAAYEIADIVALEGGASARVHLFHCKFSSKDLPGARLADLYEVVGQAVRSARWTDTPACWGELSRRITERAATRVDGGDRATIAAQLADWSDDPPGLELHVWIVQPGLSHGAMNGWTEGQTLLLATMEWCNTQGAVFHVAGSP